MYINFLKVLTSKISLIHKNSHVCNVHTLGCLKICGSRYPTFTYIMVLVFSSYVAAHLIIPRPSFCSVPSIFSTFSNGSVPRLILFSSSSNLLSIQFLSMAFHLNLKLQKLSMSMSMSMDMTIGRDKDYKH